MPDFYRRFSTPCNSPHTLGLACFVLGLLRRVDPCLRKIRLSINVLSCTCVLVNVFYEFTMALLWEELLCTDGALAKLRHPTWMAAGARNCRVTSLMRPTSHVGPYSSTMPKGLW